ncbi:MAG: AraC family transcriptional regulator [Bacteroidetes bacterium HGW-Bacteroidetes-11]|jgi:AraC-like DNA-binding protein|nr:MAG: AraC family transcriptional regulator [Bacteroidetes bacterium HGW-Bacteroidetes-11]
MKFYIKYDFNAACKKILEEQLDKAGVSYTLLGSREVEIKQSISRAKMTQLSAGLGNYGIEIIESQRNILVQKIKDTIVEMVHLDETQTPLRTSDYLSEKLQYSYGYLSNLFSEITFTSIENFIILQKIERAKHLITTTEFTVSEIAWELNYSSVAHFCTQFKGVTGLTPTVFQRIIKKRRKSLNGETDNKMIVDIHSSDNINKNS